MRWRGRMQFAFAECMAAQQRNCGPPSNRVWVSAFWSPGWWWLKMDSDFRFTARPPAAWAPLPAGLGASGCTNAYLGPPQHALHIKIIRVGDMSPMWRFVWPGLRPTLGTLSKRPVRPSPRVTFADNVADSRPPVRQHRQPPWPARTRRKGLRGLVWQVQRAEDPVGPIWGVWSSLEEWKGPRAIFPCGSGGALGDEVVCWLWLSLALGHLKGKANSRPSPSNLPTSPLLSPPLLPTPALCLEVHQTKPTRAGRQVPTPAHLPATSPRPTRACESSILNARTCSVMYSIAAIFGTPRRSKHYLPRIKSSKVSYAGYP